ncbi:MAG: ATP-binding protein, partial [Chloroflexota bacterium]
LGTRNSELEVLDLLSRLVDKSLVVAVDAGEAVRYRLLSTVRQYAQERLTASGAAEEVAKRHAAFFTALAETAETALNGPDQAAWLDRLAREHDNLRAALRWSAASGDTGLELRLAGALWKFWAVRGYLAEGRRWLDDALARTDSGVESTAAEAVDGPPATGLRARANNAAGNLARAQRDYAAARACYEAALGLWRQLGDRRGIAMSLSSLGNLANDQGDYAAARPLYEASLALRRELGDQAGIALLLNNLGSLAYNQGDHAAARGLYEESLALHRKRGDKGGVALALSVLGQIARATGDAARAKALCQESLSLFRELGDRWGTALSLGILGQVAQDEGDYQQAATFLEQSLPILRDIDDKWGVPLALLRLARVVFLQGQPARALALCREGLTLASGLGSARHVATGLEMAAELTAALGDLTPAPLSQEPGSLDHDARRSTSAGMVAGVPPSLQGKGARGLGLTRAAQVFGAAEALRERSGAAVLPADLPLYECAVSRVRDRLGEEGFATAREAGRAMPLEQAIALALEGLLDGLRE